MRHWQSVTGARFGAARATRPLPRPRLKQGGAVAIIFGIFIVFIIGMIGFALDTARLYNRRMELQSIANAAALAAASQLDGTAAGISAATAAAAAAMSTAKYSYNNYDVTWSDAALQFSPTAPPNADWSGSASASAAPATVFYVKLDTAALGAEIGALRMMLIQVLPGKRESVSLSHVAIAGRTAINVTPLAICALSPTPAAARAHAGPPALVELVEFGFRRGVSYDLMQLNSAGSSGQTFLIDPITPPGQPGKAANMTTAVVSPFVCSGSMWMPHLNGGIAVSSPFPLAALATALNSRFGQYDGTCKPNGAPPDFNVKSYTYNGGVPWMTSSIAGQSATSLASDGKLWTVADPSPTPASNTPAAYGPLWAYARAVPYSAYTASPAEPANGYTGFPTSNWSALYKPGLGITNYPSIGLANTPYLMSSGVHFTAPTGVGHLLAARQRRVLNIPLLSCPASAGSPGTATVLGIGRFFMTVPASASSLHAEFAGAVSNASNGGTVELL